MPHAPQNQRQNPSRPSLAIAAANTRCPWLDAVVAASSWRTPFTNTV